MVTGFSVEAASEGGQLMASWQDARLGSWRVQPDVAQASPSFVGYNVP